MFTSNTSNTKLIYYICTMRNIKRNIKELIDDKLYVNTIKLTGNEIKRIEKKRGKKSFHFYCKKAILDSLIKHAVK